MLNLLLIFDIFEINDEVILELFNDVEYEVEGEDTLPLLIWNKWFCCVSRTSDRVRFREFKTNLDSFHRKLLFVWIVDLLPSL